jgi:hypothetical protein
MIRHLWFFSQTRAFECVTNLTPWLCQMLVLYNSNQDNRRMIEELITHIIDNCAPLIDAIVCTKQSDIFPSTFCLP